ncbi:unnamed protein product, partial [Symbiodinium microadriaticum]
AIEEADRKAGDRAKKQTQTGEEELQLDLLGLWANVNGRGNSNVAHIHPGLLSGVLYLQAGADQGATLCFTDPRGATAGEEGRLDGDHIANDCNALEAFAGLVGLQGLRAGELLIFPSWLQHHVPPHVGTEPRISLSFNLKARIVGEKSDLQYLQFRSSEGELPPRIAGLEFMRMVHLFPNNLSQHVEEKSCSNLPARQAHTEGPRRERPPAEVASWIRSSGLAARWICATRAAAPTSRPPLTDAHGSVSLLTLPSGFVQAARTRRSVLSPATAVTGIHVLQGRLVLWLFDPRLPVEVVAASDPVARRLFGQKVALDMREGSVAAFPAVVFSSMEAEETSLALSFVLE